MENLDRLQIAIEGDSKKAVDGISKLSKTLGGLKTAAENSATGLGTLLGRLKELATTPFNESAVGDKIKSIVAALDDLKSIQKATGLNSVISSLKKLNSLEIPTISAEKTNSIATALGALSKVEKPSGLSSAINALKKIPEISAGLEKADLGKFAVQVERVAVAMRPLATEMQKVSNGFAAFPIRIQRIIQSNAGLAASNARTAKSFSISALKAGGLVLAFTNLWNRIGSWVNESNAYIENLNLFNVSMGEYAESAGRYAEEVGRVMGIDPSVWMRNQGVFMTLATGFGIASDSAAFMSKNLTQLGYDTSSFFNISVEDAMQKLQSGISGELEPLRRLGYDLSQAKLEAIALAHGIDQSVSSMTQAQKAELRYYAIMTQVTQVQGDMARTLESPANQMRVFAATTTQASRALGNLFIPLLNNVLPYAIAFVNVIRWVASEIASLFGYDPENWEVDTSGMENLTTGAETATDAIGDTTAAVKKLRDYTMGFDELNVISKDTGSGSSTGSSSIGGSLNLPLEGYDFLEGAVESKTSQIFEGWKEKLTPFVDWLTGNFDTILETVGLIGAGLLAWKLSKTFLSDTKALGVSLGVVGATLLIDNVKAVLSGEYSVTSAKSIIKEVLGGVFIGASVSLLTAGAIPISWAIPIAVVFSIVASEVIANKDKFKEGFNLLGSALDAFFGGDKEKAQKDWAKAWAVDLSMDTIANSLREAIIDKLWGEGSYARLIDHLNNGGTFADSGLTIGNSIGGSKIKDMFNGNLSIGEALGGSLFGDTIDGWVDGLKEEWETAFNDGFWNGIANNFLTGLKSVLGVVWDYLDKEFPLVTAGFKALGIDFSSETLNGATSRQEQLKTKWEGYASKPIGWYKGVNTQTKHAKLGTDISTYIYNGAKNKMNGQESSWKKVFGQPTSWFAEKNNSKTVKQVGSPLSSNLYKGARDKMNDQESSWKTTFGSPLSWFKQKNGFDKKGNSTSFKSSGSGMVSSLKTGMSTKWSELINWWKKTNLPKVQWKMPHLSWSYTSLESNTLKYKILDALGLPTQIPKLSVNWYAQGGFPTPGELFVAREAGAEMVGSIGGRTAVANNDQIVEAVSTGVYNAVLSAMSQNNNSGTPAFNIYLNGKQIEVAVKKAERERGAKIATGGLVYG